MRSGHSLFWLCFIRFTLAASLMSRILTQYAVLGRVDVVGLETDPWGQEGDVAVSPPRGEDDYSAQKPLSPGQIYAEYAFPSLPIC